MIERRVRLNDQEWTVSILGRTTVYERDEFTLLFERQDEQGRRVRRVCRFSPVGARNRARALAELTEGELATMFAQSQDPSTSPELGYAR